MPRSFASTVFLFIGCIAALGCTPDRQSYYGDFRPAQTYALKQDCLLFLTGKMTSDPEVHTPIPLYLLTPAQGIKPEDRAKATDVLPAGTRVRCIGAFKNMNEQAKTYEWVDIRVRIIEGPSVDRIASIHDLAGPDPKHRAPDPRYLEPAQ